MKTLLLVGPGENQRALACRLHQIHPLAHIANIDTPATRSKRKWFRSLVSVTAARSLRSAWAAMMAHYDKAIARWPDVPQSLHAGSNSASLERLVAELEPELVLVSGTDLLRAPIIETIRSYGRVVNLHTGISPYLKGAPNCTNWALALNEYDLIGNTLMWLDAGIDSGALIATERTALTGKETLTSLHIAVMDHAHDLLCRGYARIVSGSAVPAVPQSDIDKGRLFLIRQWNSLSMMRAASNFALRFGPRAIAEPRPIVLVGLDSK